MSAELAVRRPACRTIDYLALPRAPVVLVYGIGVDSTAVLIELVAQGRKPDLAVGSIYDDL